jgi:hypothetical protein
MLDGGVYRCGSLVELHAWIGAEYFATLLTVDN